MITAEIKVGERTASASSLSQSRGQQSSCAGRLPRHPNATRHSPVISARIDRGLFVAIDELVRRQGSTRTAFIEEMLREGVNRAGLSVGERTKWGNGRPSHSARKARARGEVA